MIREKGLTLIDVLIGIFITSLIITIATNFFINQNRIYKREELLTNLRLDMEKVLTKLIDELKHAMLDPHSTGLFKITSASPHDIVFSGDINRNGVPEPNELTRILYNPTDRKILLYKPSLSAQPLAIIANNIEFFRFTYYKRDFIQISQGISPYLTPQQIDSIQSIRIHLVGKTYAPIPGARFSGTYPDGRFYNDNFGRYEVSFVLKMRNAKQGG